MGIEIERKFLLLHEGWKDFATGSEEYRQGYLSRQEQASVRVRLAKDQAFLNIKALMELDNATSGMVRHEYEYPIPLEDAKELLGLCESTIEKTRYWVPYEGYIWEIDCFYGDNEGLVVAEIELSTPDEVFSLPPWVGKEVTDDRRYYNVELIKNPYKQWCSTF